MLMGDAKTGDGFSLTSETFGSFELGYFKRILLVDHSNTVSHEQFLIGIGQGLVAMRNGIGHA